MKVNKEMIELLPVLLKKLSNGEGLNISDLSKQYDIPTKTVQENIKKNLQGLFPDDIKYSASTHNWYSDKNFLAETLLSADELITMKLLEDHSSKISDKFLRSTQRLFNRFKKRASLTIFKKTRMEKIERDDEGKLAIIKNAIASKTVLKCRYNNKERVVHPLKIVLLEGYWYLLIYDTNGETIKTFHLKTIEALELTKEFFEAPSIDIQNKLDGAINAYFKDKPIINVELLVHKKVIRYFERQPLSKHQVLLPDNDPNYTKLIITVTDKMEIIPTIQQFLPYIKVLAPDSLDEHIKENLKNYTNTDLS